MSAPDHAAYMYVYVDVSAVRKNTISSFSSRRKEFGDRSVLRTYQSEAWMLPSVQPSLVKLEFHGTDTDTDTDIRDAPIV